MVSVYRKAFHIEGIVQGVGFRPFVYRLALGENLKGFVVNTDSGVEIEVEGDQTALNRFAAILEEQPPPLAQITRIETSDLSVQHDAEFVIRSSRSNAERTVLISPDIGICDDCQRELFDPADRRFRYPFINCTNCGPRYTIIRDIPYDRPKTTMSAFVMCPDCLIEYKDPVDRRFHAQPNACPVCGPRIWLTDATGESIETDDPIRQAIRFLKEGKIVAVKGLGGFHLACDAFSESAVSRLRQRKHREEKPLAVMSLDIPTVQSLAHVSSHERDLLLSPRRPIVLLNKKEPSPLASSVAPRNHFIGVMLPYTPLHYLLLHNQDVTTLVMTSGNLSEEPIAIDNDEALRRLSGIADVFLLHDRDIYLRSDDSVTRFSAGLVRPIRRSRGYVPVPVFLSKPALQPILAVGAELKNTLCLVKGDRAFLSQHIGDLENAETLGFFEECVDHLGRILEIKPQAIAHDLHPDYLSTQWALRQKGVHLIGVQHHHAHIAACLAENGRGETVIGLAFDGTGYGADGRVWGGEILIADLGAFRRVGNFAYRPMPGGDRAVKQPWRMALAYLAAAITNRSSNTGDDAILQRLGKTPLSEAVPRTSLMGALAMMRKQVNCPETSSLGRLFDGVAALAGLRPIVAFEGQAAMELEMAMSAPLADLIETDAYSFPIIAQRDSFLIDPDAAILQVVEDVAAGCSTSEISLRFHVGLIHLFISVCQKIRQEQNINVVALSGGCFQNVCLLEALTSRLAREGFEVLSHTQVPANDGGLALGQAAVAAQQLAHSK